MKLVSIYANYRKDPIAKFKGKNDEILKHKIATELLLHFDDVENLKKIKIVIEDQED